MDLNTALLIFTLIVIVIFVIGRAIRIRFFSALILGLLAGYLTLITLRPPQTVDGFAEGNFNALIYLLIAGLSFILIILYVIFRVFQDRAVICS